ncbi:MAG: asparaginase [Hyphomicrobiales bacterium]
MPANPVIATVTRGGITESQHHGAYAITDADGRVVASLGDIETPVFPRSAIKAFQCVPVIESGAADRFGLTAEEIALCCSSHNGEPEHVRVAASILAKCGCGEGDYECGSHWPSGSEAARDLVRKGETPRDIHNNCSGKHAGMLATARQLHADPHGYVNPAHPVQQAVAKVLERYCDVDLSKAAVGIDGCSVPTWAMPLRNTAMGFARLARPQDAVGARIIAAARSHPFMIAGTKRFDTEIMQALPRLFIKVGAEGVYCGCIPHAGLGFALKCEDGATRGADVAIAAALLKLDVWTEDERKALASRAHVTLSNWKKKLVGEVRAAV